MAENVEAASSAVIVDGSVRQLLEEIVAVASLVWQRAEKFLFFKSLGSSAKYTSSQAISKQVVDVPVLPISEEVVNVASLAPQKQVSEKTCEQNVRLDAGRRLCPRVSCQRLDAGWRLNPRMTGQRGKSCIAGTDCAIQRIW